MKKDKKELDKDKKIKLIFAIIGVIIISACIIAFEIVIFVRCNSKGQTEYNPKTEDTTITSETSTSTTTSAPTTTTTKEIRCDDSTEEKAIACGYTKVENIDLSEEEAKEIGKYKMGKYYDMSFSNEFKKVEAKNEIKHLISKSDEDINTKIKLENGTAYIYYNDEKEVLLSNVKYMWGVDMDCSGHLYLYLVTNSNDIYTNTNYDDFFMDEFEKLKLKKINTINEFSIENVYYNFATHLCGGANEYFYLDTTSNKLISLNKDNNMVYDNASNIIFYQIEPNILIYKDGTMYFDGEKSQYKYSKTLYLGDEIDLTGEPMRLYFVILSDNKIMYLAYDKYYVGDTLYNIKDSVLNGLKLYKDGKKVVDCTIF